MGIFEKIAAWPFMQEPMWRWFIFVGAMVFITAAWAIILGYMKKAA